VAIITHNGVKYEITNWDEFSFNLLDAIGHQINKEVLKQYTDEKIFFQGGFAQGMEAPRVKGNELIITNSAEHAAYLEYGTAGKKKGVTDPYGESSSGPKDRKAPPIKAIEPWARLKGKVNVYALAKHIQDYGTEPRPLYRNVMYNKNKMAQIINRAMKLASK